MTTAHVGARSTDVAVLAAALDVALAKDKGGGFVTSSTSLARATLAAMPDHGIVRMTPATRQARLTQADLTTIARTLEQFAKAAREQVTPSPEDLERASQMARHLRAGGRP